MAEEVNNISLYKNGYAFLNDADGSLIYHPRMDVLTLESQPRVPEGLLSYDSFVHYSFEGVEKEAVWLPPMPSGSSGALRSSSCSRSFCSSLSPRS